MKFSFTKEQLDLIGTLGLPVDASGDLSDEEQLSLVEVVSEHLQLHGIADNGLGENTVGKLCGDVLTIVAGGTVD